MKLPSPKTRLLPLLFLAAVLGWYLTSTGNTGEFIYKLQKGIQIHLGEAFPAYRTPLDNNTFSKKWVVITSIYAPTKSIKVLSRMEGWQVVVVGDKKTPIDWRWPNVIYLGMEDQEKLGYRILHYLPWNCFPRKAVGYLYAIQHGAEVIYETDDDNVPLGQLSLFSPDNPFRLVLNSKNSVFNPHGHFGQSSTWPRGYPLDRIGYPVSSSYTLCATQDPSVVQSLVNGDPDIDAIFRLTRRFPLERIDVKFDEKSPLFIYPSGTYTPYNCQNTLFRRSAFWSLVLPNTVSDRATDIFRAFWAERLMALVGQELGFGPASFYQLRSAHNLLKDFDKELHVYLDTKGFIELMVEWKCASKVFSECILDLTRAVINAGYYQEADYDLVDAWVEDLRRLDPALLDFSIKEDVSTCVGEFSQEVIFFPNEQPTTMPHHSRNALPTFISNKEALLGNFKSLCHSYGKYLNSLEALDKSLSEFLLVVRLQINVENNIVFFLTYYKLYFDHILFCSESKPDQSFLDKWKPSIVIFEKGKLSQISCMASASKIDFNVTGFFFMSDNMMLNVHTHLKSEKKKSLTWLPPVEDVYLTGDKCRRPDCLTINREDLNKLKSVLERSQQTRFGETRKKLKGAIIKLGKDLKSQNESQLHFLTNSPAYLPKSQISVIYRIEAIFGDSLKHNPQLLQLLFYFIAYSGNDLTNSSSSSPSADFYYHHECSSINAVCMCDHLN